MKLTKQLGAVLAGNKYALHEKFIRVLSSIFHTSRSNMDQNNFSLNENFSTAILGTQNYLLIYTNTNNTTISNCTRMF